MDDLFVGVALAPVAVIDAALVCPKGIWPYTVTALAVLRDHSPQSTERIMMRETRTVTKGRMF